MPRKDRTFNEKDVIRIIKKYLDSDGRSSVLAAIVAMEKSSLDRFIEATGLLAEILQVVLSVLDMLDRTPRIIRAVPVIGNIIVALLVAKDTLEFVAEVYDVFNT